MRTTTSPGRTRTSTRVVLLAMAAFLFAACDALDSVMPDPAPTRSQVTAQLTIWTSDPYPSPIAISVDGQNRGVLTQYRYVAPRCGVQSAADAITVVLEPGAHTISARETSGDGTWGPSVERLSPGDCLTYELMP